MKVLYDWNRFWHERSTSVSLEDGGYLVNPEGEWGRSFNPNAVTFEEIATFPCLVLLGEPGTGKSSALYRESQKMDTDSREHGEITYHLDLRSYSSEERLVRDMFENQVFLSWLSSDSKLHLYIDSLDECLLRIDTVASLIVDELKKYPVARLYLRIACRTADWPVVLERGLLELWNDQQVGIYELAPLRRRDVETALEKQNVPKDIFFKEVKNKGAVSLAIKPVTLNFLMNSFKSTGELPRTKKDLYNQGCVILCTETNDNLISLKRRTDILTPKQRLMVAARIAAVTIFSNRFAVWNGNDFGNVPEEDVRVTELSGGEESVDGQVFAVTEEVIRETISYGLFSSRGLDRLGWAHQTYAEFLAAFYLVERRLNQDQILGMLIHPIDPEQRIIPQLHQTAAWLSNLEPGMIHLIIKKDPAVLLNADVANFDESIKEELVEAILSSFDNEEILNDFEVSGLFYKLNHSRLKEQIDVYILDTSKNWNARKVAIRIAQSNHVSGVTESLKQVIFNFEEMQQLRESAGYALCQYVDESSITSLKRMASGNAGNDANDNLKGAALCALWPRDISAQELFEVLTYPQKSNYFGPYQDFLHHQLVDYFNPLDLTHALKWLEQNLENFEYPSPFDNLREVALKLGWEHLGENEIKEGLSRFIVKSFGQLNFSYNTLLKLLHTDNEKRHQLLEACLNFIELEAVLTNLIYSGMILSTDLTWCLKQAEKSCSEGLARKYVTLAWNIFDSKDKEQVEILYETSKRMWILAEKVSGFFEPVALGSPKALDMQKYYEMKLQRENKKKERLIGSPPYVRVPQLLDQIEAGDFEKWTVLNREMTLEPDSKWHGSDLESDLTSLPGWRVIDVETKSRLVNAAKSYICDFVQNPNDRSNSNVINRQALAGYRALKLLLKIEQEYVNSLSKDVWQKWASIILSYPMSSSDYNDTSNRGLLNYAYKYAPNEIIRTLITLIDESNRKLERIFILDRFDHCFDENLIEVLLEKVQDTTLSPGAIGDILQVLFKHGVEQTKDIAIAYVNGFQSRDDYEVAKAVIASNVLLTKCSTLCTWDRIWPLIKDNEEFGKRVFMDLASKFDRKMPFHDLTSLQLAELYVWLTKQFPHSEDPNHDNESMAHFVTPREHVASFRDGILNQIIGRGTLESCEAIVRIISELPELSWLKWALKEAQNLTRQKTWCPVAPSNILEVVRYPHKRLVQNGDQLLDVLIESLVEIDKKLQGVTPIAFSLWNETKKNIYKPKDEERLSDFVKSQLQDYLRQHAIVVNREVEIRNGFGNGKGEVTDIHVNAVVKDPHRNTQEVITVIIEVKGCWHKELLTAMDTQLRGRYMKDNSCDHGLYLVGWYDCDQWDDQDYKKRQVPKMSLDEARLKFEKQSSILSQNGKCIRSFVLNTALR